METDLRHRARSVRASFAPTYGLSLLGWVYAALTWNEPNRPLMATAFAVAALSTLALARLPMDRIVAGRWREPFFVSWSVSIIALIAAIVAADGGITSPTTLIYLFPLLFASLSYPVRSMAIVYAAALSSYAVVGVAFTPDPDPARVLMGLACLGFAPFVGVLQAREHDRERRELTRSAKTDALTGLLNHTAFKEQLDAALPGPMALIALDVDRFKMVNDLQGHAAGDAALRSVADAIRSVVRGGDICGRMGGDEFMVALPGADRAIAQRVVERLALALSLTPVTASAGLAVCPEDAAERDALMHAADAAMYADKRNRTRTHDEIPRCSPSSSGSTT
ncbi:GGDEF domain-containing protein [Solirubrobacter sp. CPCC 204708]|uniref:GGDEF domain-containing protein n=1 Tax=Solirubrobacter deserti TaxID=2282478 RepID=A0ABT4RCS9_9ACTN|nr:GGDEF domain-containing protein [Solirubrobacter deserti]MBE2317895.1 GGDEF domain-containing protein [Solirubrobacter deserti]MDA0136328.1 GGDEF domain-containing protein [Solirubrobacter deserti]